MEESKSNENEIIFDDRELDELSDNPIEIDEQFENEMSKKLDDYLKKHPFEFED